jgi:hypothetical protein
MKFKVGDKIRHKKWSKKEWFLIECIWYNRLFGVTDCANIGEITEIMDSYRYHEDEFDLYKEPEEERFVWQARTGPDMQNTRILHRLYTEKEIKELKSTSIFTQSYRKLMSEKDMPKDGWIKV